MQKNYEKKAVCTQKMCLGGAALKNNGNEINPTATFLERQKLLEILNQSVRGIIYI